MKNPIESQFLICLLIKHNIPIIFPFLVGFFQHPQDLTESATSVDKALDAIGVVLQGMGWWQGILLGTWQF